MQLALLGGGRMGESLVSGLLDAGWETDSLAVAEIDPERRRVLEQRFPGVRVAPSPAWAVAEADVVVVAVKPGDVTAALDQCLTSLKTDALVLSIAAGVTLATLEEAVPDRPVVRAMPNTAALVRKGAAAIAAGRHATGAHLDEAERILGAVGVVVRVPEKLLDAVTGLSGSGPAYVFLVAEAMIEAGVLVGLDRDTAATLVLQTLVGAASLLADGVERPEALRAAVTSPGGTTAAGPARPKSRSVRAAFLEAVEAATRRSADLGRSD
jgi:pyrroline-5-carboxylate reductase